MEFLYTLVGKISSFVWGPWVIGFLVGTGIFLSVRVKFIQFTHLGYALRLGLSRKSKADEAGDISHFGALMTALAATVGTGNIVGVATAVILGGPGAVFWMWVTAIFGMATKYGEAVLAIKYRVTDSSGNMAGGPMYFLEKGLNLKWLGILFAIFGVMASFGIGNMTQSNSVAGNVMGSFHVAPWISGLIMAVFTGVVILGGVKSIAKASSVIVPLMAILYVFVGLIVLVMNLSLIPPALGLIFSEAFSMKAGLGGLIGATIRYGVARGVFSNEAGLGSAPIAAAAAKTDHPCRQALVSMTGTFLDTIIVCSVNGLVLVMAGLSNHVDFGGLKAISEATPGYASTLTSQSFNMFLPAFGGLVVTISLIFFAYSTILGWSYYGERCLYYLTESKTASFLYRLIFAIFVFIGAVAKLSLAWDISDIFNGAMAIPNLIGLLGLSGVIVSQTKDFFDRIYSKELAAKKRKAAAARG
ncbi:MAG: sodium:alanine symporter family protein [Deltaproteobacteria bacterium]|jgi:AGCS family alanine or glycine:cation symporter|nr:sodium:alanine symporter family protein [Deltaproteobacteria bacterium]